MEKGAYKGIRTRVGKAVLSSGEEAGDEQGMRARSRRAVLSSGEASGGWRRGKQGVRARIGRVVWSSGEAGGGGGTEELRQGGGDRRTWRREVPMLSSGDAKAMRSSHDPGGRRRRC